jgi:hypothetical protein
MRARSGRPLKISPSIQTVPASSAWRSVSEMRGSILRLRMKFIS